MRKKKTCHHHETAWTSLICKAQADRPAEQDWQVCQNIHSNPGEGGNTAQPSWSPCPSWVPAPGWAVPAHLGVTSSPLLLTALPILFWAPRGRFKYSHVNTLAFRRAWFQVFPRAGHRTGALGAQLSSSPFPKPNNFKSLVVSWGMIRHSAIGKTEELP